MTEKEIKQRIDAMEMAGHHIFTFEGVVSLPEEVEAYFTEEEQKELLAYVEARI